MITTIILSKDRPAQLDLLLRSIEQNGGGFFNERWVVHPDQHFVRTIATSYGARTASESIDGKIFDFGQAVQLPLDHAGEFVCFMCDDGILYRPLPSNPVPLPPPTLCLSLRLGDNTMMCYPSGLSQMLPEPRTITRGGEFNDRQHWDWTLEPQDPGVSDFGYPGSIDGHVFRTADVQRMLAGRSFPNPTALECALVEGCKGLAAKRPLMACYPHSVYVGNPINRVSEQSNVRFGTRFPVSAEECNRRFLAGERIDLGALDFSDVDGAHTEIDLRWKS